MMSESLSSEEYILLSDEVTNLDYGFFPQKRPINIYLNYGFIPLDKPRGPSSHEVVAWVRKMLQIEKAGHSGTLDPPVSGVLPIALGNATKALGLFLLGPKEYITVVRLHNDVQEQKILDVFKEFTGTIYQRPPQRSSVKRVTRTKRIYQINLIEKLGRLIVVKVACEAGTYIRKLVYDIGEVLGVGATMVELRRTRVFNIDEEQGLVRLHDLSAAIHKWKNENNEELIRKLVQPIENVLTPFKKVLIKDSAVDAVCHGAQVAIPGIVKLSSNIVKGDLVVILTLKGELVALGKALLSANEIEELVKGFAVKIERVVMDKGTYPKVWK
ncbi:MAG: RNA-guided pseudouridylation complex pseudouridine synthase subunit Cbf5 [Nitrososphaeria archaeon]|nr:RNA-guided pseudouridylation complex pseudouridine synthase subunit Cbf5 [Nitrososphaeria archaeon]